jgi:hypothetical protein
MRDVRPLSIPLQTIYAELVDRAWSGDFAELMAAGGTPYTREVNGKLFWYWRTASAHGVRPAPKYLGPDSEAMRARIMVQKDLAAIRKERRDLVRALRSANMPGPDRLTGNILAALAAAGAFRLRAVLIGSVAFQCYLPLLGVRFPATIARTGDLDLAQFHSVSVAVEDEMEADLLSVLRQVDSRFQPIMSPADSRKIMRYAIQVGTQEEFSVEVLCPLRGPIRENFTVLKSLRGSAQILKHLDFLIYREVNAVALHGPGIPVNVPAPERFAMHKLIVSQLRIDTPRSQQKARKDLQQADALVRVLASDRPDDLKDAWNELRQRGPAWRLKADRAVAQLPDDTRQILRAMTNVAE